MNDQELKDVWRKQKLEDAAPIDARAQIEAVRNRMSKLHRTLNWRDLRELVASVFVIVVFSVYFFIIPYPVTRIGDLIVIGGTLFASWRIIEWRKRAPRPEAGAPMALWLTQERARVYHEAELLRTVLWWYILPIWFGVNVFYWGFPNRAWVEKIAYTGVTALVCGWIYWLNQVARRKQLLPVADDLEVLLQKESPAGTTTEDPSSAQRRNRFTGAGIILVVFLAGLIFVWNSPRSELPRAPGFDDVSAFNNDASAKVDAWLQEQLVLAQYPSLSVAIVRDGKIVYQNAFGFEDIKARRKAAPETSYHVASVTKAFTASIAVMLHARGVIDLDQPVGRYLPKNVSISTKPKLGATITLRQLASHTSGLPRGIPGAVQSVEGRYQLEPKRLYEHLADATLESEPGTKELYSNLGFGLLGHVLELAAGQPFDRLLQEMLCAPLQLESTAIQESGKLRVATGYSSTVPRRAVKHSYRERLASSGGLIASAPDLAQFLLAQMKPGLFTSEMLAQLHTASKLSNGTNTRTALGWNIGRSKKAGRILEKNGGRNNCSAWIGFAPEHEVGVVVLTNCGEPSVDPIGRWLLDRCIPGGQRQ